MNLFKGKGSASTQGNYRRFKLTVHVLKVIEKIVKKQIRPIIFLGEMQLSFIPGVRTADAIFIMCQLQETRNMSGRKKKFMTGFCRY